MSTLSTREAVLQGLVAGKPNKVIAFDFDISEPTVDVYRAHVNDEKYESEQGRCWRNPH